MKQLPDLKQLSDKEKDGLIVELWQIIEQLTTELETFKAKKSPTKKTSKNSSIPPSQGFKENKKDQYKKSSTRKANRKGGGRKLNPQPDQKDLFAAVRSVVNTVARQGLSAYEASAKRYLPIPLFLPLVE